MKLVYLYFYHYFPFFYFVFCSITNFSHRMAVQIKNVIQQKLTGAAKNLGLYPFPDPLSHFGALWRPLRIFQAVSELPFTARPILQTIFVIFFINFFMIHRQNKHPRETMTTSQSSSGILLISYIIQMVFKYYRLFP